MTSSEENNTHPNKSKFQIDSKIRSNNREAIKVLEENIWYHFYFLGDVKQLPLNNMNLTNYKITDLMLKIKQPVWQNIPEVNLFKKQIKTEEHRRNIKDISGT